MNKKYLAKAIDHTLLKPDANKEQIDRILNEAKEYGFASVCINPQWVKHAYGVLKDTDVKVCTVIGFPLGATSSETKAFETKQAIQDGAKEIDMVIAIGSLKSGDDDYVEKDIRSVVKAAGDNAIVKVIIETTLLTDDEKIRACRLAQNAGADFVKTSTGFAGGGATVADVKLMFETVGPDLEVKASGGVKDLDTMQQMLEAGATRIGASAGISIINGLETDTDY
ncbi:deoxyribose-phosphate aldolase [Gracilibacillus xinjiangensis]|uniref:Deoxyribose-phosphate aldolase n=1 Tax=Gracilibacillus xinjiangensis TaxID=1193282 RepID=A0ABV8WWB2_9BACI